MSTRATDHGPRPKGGRHALGYHDPTHEMGGAAPAHSPLSLRLALAGSGFAVFALGALLLGLMGAPVWLVVVAVVVAVVALVDVVVVARRKASGEPG